MNNEKLVQCFVDAIGIPKEMVLDGLSYQSVKGWDSVGHMSLVAAIEMAFDIMLDTDEILSMNSYAMARSILQIHGVNFDAA